MNTTGRSTPGRLPVCHPNTTPPLMGSRRRAAWGRAPTRRHAMRSSARLISPPRRRGRVWRICRVAAVAIERKQAEVGREELLASERNARSEAERASHMKDEFLATLSHELRTPLNAILGWSQILAASDKDPDEVADGLRTIERNARAQTQIIEDLLDMSRIISGKIRLDVQRIDLAMVARAAMETVKPAAEAKGIR